MRRSALNCAPLQANQVEVVAPWVAGPSFHNWAVGGKGYSVAAFNAETEDGRSFLEAAVGAMAARWNGAKSPPD